MAQRFSKIVVSLIVVAGIARVGWWLYRTPETPRQPAYALVRLRSGPISAAELEACLPFPVAVPARHGHAVPGNQRIHYRPNAALRIVSTSGLVDILQNPPRDSGFMLHSPQFRALQLDNVRVMPAHHQGYRQALYGTLHELDGRVATIWVESPPTGAEWQDIWDRLSRAATA